MLGSLTRRAFLSVLGAFAPVGSRLFPGRQAPSVTLDEFVGISERLTGRRPLDRTTARTYLDALLVPPDTRALLADLAHGRRGGARMSPAHVALEGRIVESWYTGVHDVNGTAQVADYTGGLMWTVLGRPAPGSCAGEPGHWAKPPESRP